MVCVGVRDYVIKWIIILIVNNIDILLIGFVYFRFGMLNIVLKNFSNNVFFFYYNKVEDIFIYIEKLYYSSGFLVVVWFFFKNK